MSSSTLANELESLIPAITEAEAITAVVEAYSTYCEDAQASTPIKSAGIDLGKAAMSPALVGLSTPNQAATVIVAGIQAFWSAVALGLTTSFDGATAITPPFATLNPTDLQTVFDSNLAAEKSLSDATLAIATAIHAKLAGGIVTTPGPTNTPII